MLRTARLDLVNVTPALARADLAGREMLAELLGIPVPANWPPELYDAPAVEWTLAMMEERPESQPWAFYYVVLREPEPVVVGIAGYKGSPTPEHTVEVGYSVLPEYRRRGIATEATAALIERAFSHPEVTAILAETLPELIPSIGVMEKLGFAFVGPGSEDGVVRYRLDRP